MAKRYWFKACQHCEQGRLFIYMDITNDNLYLHCEECEWGWRDPNELSPAHGFLTIDEDFDATPATMFDITRFSWEKFADETDDE